MPIHCKVSGAWKDVEYPSVKTGGAWEDGESTTGGVQDVYVNVSGTWYMAWPMNVSFNKFNARSRSSVANSCYIDIRTDGAIHGWGTGTGTPIYSYYAENYPDTDKNDGTTAIFQWRWRSDGAVDVPDTFVQGSAGSAAVENTWYDLSYASGSIAGRATVTWPGTGPNVTGGFHLDIRAKHATSSEVSSSGSPAYFTLSAENSGA